MCLDVLGHYCEWEETKSGNSTAFEEQLSTGWANLLYRQEITHTLSLSESQESKSNYSLRQKACWVGVGVWRWVVCPTLASVAHFRLDSIQRDSKSRLFLILASFWRKIRTFNFALIIFIEIVHKFVLSFSIEFIFKLAIDSVYDFSIK